eukprot:TRINITY_DN209_c0_g1_i3.p1 TRINITY_DN209_c0_g1~~TRINITY_DN209_c0_g1_i3.p1  ORF type:complete len:1081 (-),score=328.39 TRINITY_DN209_c0_g1_i3:311-3553(-)
MESEIERLWQQNHLLVQSKEKALNLICELSSNVDNLAHDLDLQQSLSNKLSDDLQSEQRIAVDAQNQLSSIQEKHESVIDKLNKEIRSKNSLIDELKDNLNRANSTNSNLRSDLENQNDQQQKDCAKMRELQNTISLIEKELDQFKNSNVELTEKFSGARLELNASVSQVNELQQSLESGQKQMKGLANSLKQSEDENVLSNQKLNEKKREHMDLKEEFEKYMKKKDEEFDKEHTMVISLREINEQQKDEIEKQNKKHELENIKFCDELEELKSNLDTLEKENIDLSNVRKNKIELDAEHEKLLKQYELAQEEHSSELDKLRNESVQVKEEHKHKIEELQTKERAHEKQLRELENNSKQMQEVHEKQLKELENDNKELQRESSKTIEMNSNLEAKNMALSKEIDVLENRMTQLKEKQGVFTVMGTELETAKDSLEKTKDSLEKSKTSLEETKNSLEVTRNQLLSVEKEKHEAEVLLREIEISKAEVDEKLKLKEIELVSVENDRDIAEMTLEKSKNDLDERNSVLEQQKKNLEREIQRINKDLKDKGIDDIVLSLSGRKATETSGFLFKKSSRGLRRNWLRRYFEIKDGTMTYFENNQTVKSKGTWKLDQVSVMKKTHKRFALYFELHFANDDKPMCLHCPDLNEYEGWMEVFEQTTLEVLESSSSPVSTKKSLGSKRRASFSDYGRGRASSFDVASILNYSSKPLVSPSNQDRPASARLSRSELDELAEFDEPNEKLPTLLEEIDVDMIEVSDENDDSVEEDVVEFASSGDVPALISGEESKNAPEPMVEPDESIVSLNAEDSSTSLIDQPPVIGYLLKVTNEKAKSSIRRWYRLDSSGVLSEFQSQNSQKIEFSLNVKEMERISLATGKLHPLELVFESGTKPTTILRVSTHDPKSLLEWAKQVQAHYPKIVDGLIKQIVESETSEVVDLGIEGVEVDIEEEDIICSGYLLKKSSGIRSNWLRRHFILEGNQLSYYKTEQDAMEKGSFDISQTKLFVKQSEKYLFYFEIHFPDTGDHPLCLRAESQEDLARWLQNLELVCQEALVSEDSPSKKRFGRRKSSFTLQKPRRSSFSVSSLK